MFSKEDERIVEILKPVVKGIAALLGKNCEVVLHSFKDMEHSVVAIENGEITNRHIGSSLTDSGLEILNDAIKKNKEIVGPYKSVSPTGTPLRSVTIPIRNKKGKLIASLCLNMDLTAAISIREFLKPLTEFVEDEKLSGDVIKSSSPSIDGLMRKVFNEVVLKAGAKGNLPVSKRNKLIVRELYKRNFFQIKNSVNVAASKLGVSKFTIYNYLRELKEVKNGEKHH